MSSEKKQGYDSAEAEKRWAEEWEKTGLYRWDSTRPRQETFVVDTPPPTVSGSLHLGHVYSYTHTDVITRYQRMLNKNIFYPMGWDDNGLPTERRVQNYYNIRCNAALPYNPDWKAAEGRKETEEVSRRNFIEACAELTAEDEKAFEALWRTLGLSIDWSLTYATIDDHCRRTSQHAFLKLVEKGQAYNSHSPTIWDVDYRSAVAQAEIEDREVGGAFHDIQFGIEGGGSFTIATTRPELLAACIAVVAHPSDERYQNLFGKHAITPLFHAKVPILPAEHADPEKGTGILMVCTFGDAMDVEFWKTHKLPLKQLLGLDGKFIPQVFGAAPFLSEKPSVAQSAYDSLVGLAVKQARKQIVSLLSAEGSDVSGSGASALLREPREIMHTVKFYEKGDRPLEFIPTRQWFIRLLDHKEALLEQGRKVRWHPSHMLSRYENWVQGLNQDWCISRQRFFGVPFPVWYPINSAGEVEYDKPILAQADSLPVDPLSETPPGFKDEQRNMPGGFYGDPDVMDTWATSSLTPQIMSHWVTNQDRHTKLFPMSIRPQGHDIIRTWAFYTITQAYLHDNQIPWTDATISGWILDPDRKKMSKSKGNVITPGHLLSQYSSDAIRYWAARGRLGADTAVDEKVFKIGQKLTTKLANAARFVMIQIEESGTGLTIDEITEPLDRAFISKLAEVINSATRSLEAFDYASALYAIEDTFWFFCDHYLELVKGRSYDGANKAGQRSAHASLKWSLSAFLRLFAPYIPFVTEEVWSSTFGQKTGGSVHKARWPSSDEVDVVTQRAPAQDVMKAALEVIGKIRGAKTAAKRSLKWPVSSLRVTGSPEALETLKMIAQDVLRTGNVSPESLVLATGETTPNELFVVEIGLAEESPQATVEARIE